MKFSEETSLDENKTQNDKNEIYNKLNNIISEHSKKKFNPNQNLVEKNSNISFFLYLNNFLEIYKPGFTFDRIDFNLLSIKIPLCLFIVLIIIKFFISSQLTFIYLLILISLPFCALILINKIILENYIGELTFSDMYNTNLLKDFHKLFIISIFPLIFFQYLTLIINSSSFVGKLSNILFVIYSADIAQKFFFDYLKIAIINNCELIINDEKNKIFFIYLIIFSLISYIINL